MAARAAAYRSSWAAGPVFSVTPSVSARGCGGRQGDRRGDGRWGVALGSRPCCRWRRDPRGEAGCRSQRSARPDRRRHGGRGSRRHGRRGSRRHGRRGSRRHGRRGSRRHGRRGSRRRCRRGGAGVGANVGAGVGANVGAGVVAAVGATEGEGTIEALACADGEADGLASAAVASGLALGSFDSKRPDSKPPVPKKMAQAKIKAKTTMITPTHHLLTGSSM